MDVLLSKLSYRLYELESHSLSYRHSPVESLIEVKEGLDWLSNMAKAQFELMPMAKLLDSFQHLVINLQRKHSPFNANVRDLLLEFIDLARQLVLEQSFYSASVLNLPPKHYQIENLISKVALIDASLDSSKQLIKHFEAEVDQDDDDWLNKLIDFVERFSRVGEYYFEGGLNYKLESASQGLTQRSSGDVVHVFKLGVKTAQSLAWMKANFDQFQWISKDILENYKEQDLRPLFKGIRLAKSLMPKRAQREFKYPSYYNELESLYLKTQALSLEKIAEKLSIKLKASVGILPSQSKQYVDIGGAQDLEAEIDLARGLGAESKNAPFTLLVRDVSGTSWLSLINEDVLKELAMADFSSLGQHCLLSIPIDADVLEYQVRQMLFANHLICVPEEKVLLIHNCEDDLVIHDESCSFIKMHFGSIGVVDVFVSGYQNLPSQGAGKVVLIKEFGFVYGILASDIMLQQQANKVPSHGLSTHVNMLWELSDSRIVPEINPLTYSINNQELSVDRNQIVDVSEVSSGWVATIAGLCCFIQTDIVEKHVTTMTKEKVLLPEIQHSLIRLEGECYPYIDVANQPSSSLVLLGGQQHSVCISVNSIYYEKDMTRFMDNIETVERLSVNSLSEMIRDHSRNTLYVVDVNSFD